MVDLKKIFHEGKISEIIPETGGGISGEAHLLEYKNKKFIVRICRDLKTAKKYEKISLKLKKFKIFPKFLGRYGKNVFYEFLEGRDLRENEILDVYRQMGRITAIVGTFDNLKGETRFYAQVKKLESGNFFTENHRVQRRNERYGERLDKRRIKSIFSKKMAREVEDLYEYLSKNFKLEFICDINDITKENFRLSKGRVYFVDIEAIKPRLKGFGIAKCFLKIAKTENRRKSFKKGFEEVSEWFFEGEYADLCYLMYTVQDLVFRCQIGRKHDESLNRLKKLLKKYSTKK
jgi:hypothetical protein